MDDTTLVRELLKRATGSEPPIGPMPQNALRQGIGLRRRRRARIIAATAGVLAVIGVAALALTGEIANRSAAPAPIPATAYVLGGSQTLGTLTPISTISNRPGRPIVAEKGNGPGWGPRLAVTPDRKTIWVADNDDDVTPVSTVTNRAEKPIRVVYQPDQRVVQVLAAPDDKTIYVLDSTGTVTPISAATHKKGKPIQVVANAAHHSDGGGGEMAITPDGKTLYVLVYPPGPYPSDLVPIATATNRPGKPIGLPIDAGEIVITADSRTAYVFGYPTAHMQRIEVLPISTAANHLGTPIIIGNGFIQGDTPVVMTPDGKTLYIPDSTPNGVIPFSTVTNTPGKLIGLGSAFVEGIAISPDGSTAYVVTQPSSGPGGGSPTCFGYVTPIAAATNTVGRPTKVGCSPSAVAVTPDGRTLYVSAQGTVTPVASATGRAGTPIPVEGPEEILIVPRPG